MDVVRKNFKDALPLISDSIKKADFISVDAEFTGLLNGRDVSYFDLPEDYYNCMLSGSSDFLLIQFGLCAFYWDDSRNHYMNDTYNFYLFPRGRPAPDRMFLCQSSSLEFLAANSFDFNKLIKEGISYMTEPTEAKLREMLTERQLNYSREKDAVRIPEENKQQIEDYCKKVQSFIDNKKEDEMEIDKCNSFIRLLLFQEFRLRFKNDIIVDTKILENKTRVLKITKKKPDMEDEDVLRKKKEWEELEEAIGFSKVARMLSQSEKLVVGHNMLLDVLHTLGHFFQPLPSDYKSFKEFAHCMFPKLLDTKFMSSCPPFKDKLTSSVLAELLSTLAEPPFSLPKVGSLEGRGYSQSDDKHHEAGYDAYMTGLCFLAMHAHLARGRAERVTQHLQTTLKPFLNKLFLAKTARQDSPYMNLDGVDPSPSRDHVFHLEFPTDWQRNDINQLFSPFGAITVQFINETSAYIGLDGRDQAADVARTLAKNSLITLTPYNKYKSMAQRGTRSEMALPRSDLEQLDTYKPIASADTKSRQVVSNLAAPRTPPQMPQKVSRVRSSSVSMTSPPVLTRKRSSSGVFEVDELEPPPQKKPEVIKSLRESPRKRPELSTNEHRKTTENAEGGRVKENFEKKKSDKKKSKVIEKFDSKAKSNCVAAFKESDSWD